MTPPRHVIFGTGAIGLTVLDALRRRGRVTPVIDRTYPLEEGATAIRRMQDGKARGKLVVAVSPATTQTSDPGSTA
jgi:D-arabinose 1-dehydrogenase-like Zn-dependent alcohol dehydrogenase